jgi:hypothetical protein
MVYGFWLYFPRLKSLLPRFPQVRVHLVHEIHAVNIICASACLLATEAPRSASGTPAPQIEATVYYSKEDPHWADAEKILETVARKYSPLKLTKVSIDDDAGYRQLFEAEQRLHVAQPGDLTVVIRAVLSSPPVGEDRGELAQPRGRGGQEEGGTAGASPAAAKESTEELALTSSDERRDVEHSFEAVIKRLRNPDEGKGRVESNVPAFAAEVFGKAARLEAQPYNAADHNRCYAVFEGAKLAGWIVDAFRHIACPVCNDMQFLMAVSAPDLKVLLIRPQRDLERLAAKMDDKDSQAFLTQFKGRGPETSQIKVDAISGATKTCRLYESAVRDALAEIQKREKR